MEKVLTVASDVSCDHPPTGGGKVQLVAGQNVLMVSGASVLAQSQATAEILPGCSQTNTQAGEVVCSTVLSQSAGYSTVLKVNGQPVLLETAGGTTNGLPDSAWSAKDAKQEVLKAD